MPKSDMAAVNSSTSRHAANQFQSGPPRGRPSVPRQYPSRPRSARTGSNLEQHERIAAWERRGIEKKLRDFRKMQSAFQRRRRGLLTGPVIRKAAPLFEAARTRFAQSLLKTMGRDADIGRAKQRARRVLERSLRQAIPAYEAFEALQQEYSDSYDAVIDAHRVEGLASPVRIGLGDKVDAGAVPIDQFEPPFALFDVYTFDPENLLRFNQSFADPSSGVVMNDIRFHRNEDSWGNQYNPTRFSLMHSSVGINYRVQRTGFLNVAVVMQNLFNKVEMRVTDNIGFSHAYLHVYHNLEVYVVRGGSPFKSFVKPVLSSTGLISHGSDLQGYGPDIPTSLYTFSFDVDDAFLAGEDIQVLAGCSLRVDANLDDMEAFVTAMLAWQVQKLYVWIGD